MNDFDLLSFKLELADLLDKYNAVLISEQNNLYAVYKWQSYLVGNDLIEPKELRK